MGIKERFLEALDLTPDGVQDYAEKTIPSLSEISSPTTVEEAIKAQGILAANINKILKEFEGLSLVELLLRIGQRSTVSKAMLLTMLKYTPKATDYAIDIVSHTEGQACVGEQSITATVESGLDDLESITAHLSGPEVEDLTLSPDGPNLFSRISTITMPGLYTLRVEAVFKNDQIADRTIHFTLQEG